jgi:OHCU decarboxylase
MILGGPAEGAREALLACCGSALWVEEMMRRRPFASVEALQAAATDAFDALGAGDWLDAFAAHPRIGERQAAVDTGTRAAHWSRVEQAAMAEADDDLRGTLAEAQREYEDRFGHIFLVCASGRSASELLADCRARLANDADTELRVAAGEQRKITSLRLARLAEAAP